MNIVIIDDEKDIGFILGFELKSHGHTTFDFDTAQDAQDFFLKTPRMQVDLIICDFQMPKMTGLEFFNWLKSINITAPFFVLTGEPTMDTQELIDKGISQVLFKPQDLKKIPDLILELNTRPKS